MSEMNEIEYALKLTFKIFGAIFLIPFSIFLFCAWWQIGGIAIDIVFEDKEANLTNMFQLTYVSLMTIGMISISAGK